MVDAFPFLARLLRYWKSRGVPHLPGVTDSEIRAFEERNEINLSAEVRAFYSNTNGTEVPGTEGTDDKQFDFWPLEDVHFVEGETSTMYFADVLQYLFQFAFEVTGNNDAGNGSVFAVSSRSHHPSLSSLTCISLMTRRCIRATRRRNVPSSANVLAALDRALPRWRSPRGTAEDGARTQTQERTRIKAGISRPLEVVGYGRG